MANGVHKITEEFENKLSEYTGAPFTICLDNQSNALFLSLTYYKLKHNLKDLVVNIPQRTYPSVPCEIIHTGSKVKFVESEGKTLKGAYQLDPTNVWDSALRFTSNMYIPNSFMCLSFTGPYKHLKLSKGGAILTDDFQAYKWFKKARFSGRDECSYHDDDFDNNPVIGWNFYMMPEIATRGLLLLQQFYNADGTKKTNEDIELPYPDLSKYKLYQQ
jgi:dTDP-4-amino-4,6-dideoxygalactose transaminase